MCNEVLYVLLPDFAEHEMVYLAQAISSDEFSMKENPKYVNKVVAPEMEPVKSIGGFRMLPDYSFGSMPDDYAALVLVGGFGWSSPDADKVVPIVRNALEKGKIVGAICNAASFMAKHGFLNEVEHTGNGPEQLKQWGGGNYTNASGYRHRQAVSDHGIVTANGSATLEFAKELLLLLENDTPQRIEMYYQFNRQGFCELFKISD
ncbi:MAG: DJ-1/PfpI family protein [Bacteroides sp.]|nr:DJ-1/PfpI family protein [Bacteroides sp.]